MRCFLSDGIRTNDRKRDAGTLLLAALILLARPAGFPESQARAQATDVKAADLVGKRVVPKSSNFALKVDGRTVERKLAIQGYVVERSDQDRLWLRGVADGVKGQASASDVVSLDNAFDFFTEQIRKKPNDGFSYLVRSVIRAGSRQEYDLALSDLDRAIRLNPTVEAYIARGALWQSIKNDYDKAIADYDRAIQLDPKQSWGFSNRGLAWSMKKEYDKAIADFDQAIRLDPKQSLIFSNRGRTWLRKKEYDKAIADFDQAIRLDPNQAENLGLRGVAWRFKKEYAKAIADYDRAIRLAPENPTSYAVRGNTFKLIREYDKAIADFDRAIRLEPEKASHHSYRAMSAFLRGRNTDAVASMKEALDKSGWREKNSPYWAIIGYFAARRAGKLSEARALLDDFKAKGDTTSWPYPVIRYLRGEIGADDLIAASTDNDKRTESHCYVGLDLLLKRKPSAAKDHFLWVKERGNPEFNEYDIVQAELERMDMAKQTGKKR